MRGLDEEGEEGVHEGVDATGARLGGRADKVYMAAVHGHGRLGVAWLDLESLELCVAEAEEAVGEMEAGHSGWEGGGGASALALAKRQARPDVIYAPANADAAFLHVLSLALPCEECAEGGAGAAERHAPASFAVKTARATDFGIEAVRCRLAGMVEGGGRLWAQGERMMRVGTAVDLGRVQQLRALGALLAVLEHEDVRAGGAREQDAYGNTVRGACIVEVLTLASVREVTLTGIMTLDRQTMEALSIFKSDTHASQMGIGGAREGFSLFGLVSTRAVTPVGRRLLAQWFSAPLTALDALGERQEAVRSLRGMGDLVAAVRAAFKGVKDVPRCLLAIRSCTATIADWLCLVGSLHAFVAVAGLVGRGALAVGSEGWPGEMDDASEAPKGVPRALAALAADIGCQEVRNLACAVGEILDPEQWRTEGTGFYIQRGISEDLDDLKEVYAGLDKLLAYVTSTELARCPMLAQRETYCAYFPGGVGYVVAVSKHGPEFPPDLFLTQCADFEFLFESDECLHFRTASTRQLDEELGDVHARIIDMESCMLRDLEIRALERDAAVSRSSRAVAQLDCLCAFAVASLDFGWNCLPRIVNESVIRIEKGRHPLQEMCVQTFIPNDAHFVEDSGRVAVINGANFSGKSVYAKQVAVIVFLAQLGGYVPASTCVVGPVDRIFSRILSTDTVREGKSAFYADLTQVYGMIRHSTCRSLLVVDEFGKGTLSSDGAAMLIATLKSFIRRGSLSRSQPMVVPSCVEGDPYGVSTEQRTGCPLVIVSTHFSEVLDSNMLPRSPLLAFYTMDVVREMGGEATDTASAQRTPTGTREGDVRSLAFLYQLVPREAEHVSSYGLVCARCAGISQAVLERAASIIEVVRAGRPIRRMVSRRTKNRDAHFTGVFDQIAWREVLGDPRAFLAALPVEPCL